MSNEPLELVHGSGNVYSDFNDPQANVKQAKALLAAEIIKVLDAENLSTRAAQARTGVDHSEFVRIRQVNLKRFTIDRLILILGQLNQDVDITIITHPKAQAIAPEVQTA